MPTTNTMPSIKFMNYISLTNIYHCELTLRFDVGGEYCVPTILIGL